MKAPIIILLLFLKLVLCQNLQSDFCRDYLQDLEKLQKFTKEYEKSRKYSLPSVDREGINPEDVTLFIYTNRDIGGVEIPLTDANTITEVSSFNTELKTVFYVHGWHDTATGQGSRMIKNALMEVTNVNIIMVNWNECAKNIDYFISMRCLADVGKYIGIFIETVTKVYSYSLSDITVVGHSLGAHAAGHVGKYFNGTLSIIIGLDPAGPFFFEDNTSSRLTQDDAQYVQAIHTDGLLLGVNYNLGHSDFWPNGGLWQPGCEAIDGNCSHLKAYKYYAESITNNSFFARNCDSYDDFKSSKCTRNFKSMMGGVSVNTSAFGTFYLDTHSEPPYGMGDIV